MQLPLMQLLARQKFASSTERFSKHRVRTNMTLIGELTLSVCGLAVILLSVPRSCVGPHALNAPPCHAFTAVLKLGKTFADRATVAIAETLAALRLATISRSSA